jgi:hypothetical protein
MIDGARRRQNCLPVCELRTRGGRWNKTPGLMTAVVKALELKEGVEIEIHVAD